MVDTFPTVRAEAKIPSVRKRKATGRQRKDREKNQWTRERLDYKQLEAAKQFVGTILYKDVQPSERNKRGYRREIRVSILPWSNSGYLDVRVYINGNSTGQGVLCHLDHATDLISFMLDAKTAVDRLIRDGVISPPKGWPT